ncbi:MAG: 16S rRNA (guanine(527)-N(7))-methyltransferase RsmG [Acidimicrobiales bacterium]
MSSLSADDLRPYLVHARELGFVGAASVDNHLHHSLAFLDLVRGVDSNVGRSGQAYDPAKIVDLGSGGGIPGLVLAVELKSTTITLLESSERRAVWLSSVVENLSLTATVAVIRQRAEDFGRLAASRNSFNVVTARSFGPPAVVAECAAPLLDIGGHLIVSEPPAEEVEGGGNSLARWPATGLAEFGFGIPQYRRSRGLSFVDIPLVELCPDRYPRRVGIPAKRPRF